MPEHFSAKKYFSVRELNPCPAIPGQPMLMRPHWDLRVFNVMSAIIVMIPWTLPSFYMGGLGAIPSYS